MKVHRIYTQRLGRGHQELRLSLYNTGMVMAGMVNELLRFSLPYSDPLDIIGDGSTDESEAVEDWLNRGNDLTGGSFLISRTITIMSATPGQVIGGCSFIHSERMRGDPAAAWIT